MGTPTTDSEARCAECGSILGFGNRAVAVFDTEMGSQARRLDIVKPVITEDPELLCGWDCFFTHFAREAAARGRHRRPRVP